MILLLFFYFSEGSLVVDYTLFFSQEVTAFRKAIYAAALVISSGGSGELYKHLNYYHNQWWRKCPHYISLTKTIHKK